MLPEEIQHCENTGDVEINCKTSFNKMLLEKPKTLVEIKTLRLLCKSMQKR